MVRRLVLALLAAASSGCFDFDAAYARYCDAGRCADAGGGGGGGGSGGGGGGGAMDAGCQAFLCPELDWKSNQASSFYTVAPGILSESLANFRVLAAFRGPGGSGSPFQQLEFRFLDGGVTALDRTSMLDSRVEVRQLRGVSMTDYWFTYRTYATHYDENTAAQADFGPCTLPDGGPTDPWHYAVAPVAQDDAWLVGYPMSICHWTAAGGLTATADPTAWPNVYLNDVYRAPSGAVYAVGGDYLNSEATCVIFREDGTQLQTPPVVDSYYGDGCNSVGGTGDAVYALARSDANAHGQILALQPDGGFASVYTAPFRLAQLEVTPGGEVWAVGKSNARAVYFDGGAWGVVPLPLTELRPGVNWENVDATADGLVLSGFEMEADGGNTAVVNAYRRFGH